MKKVIFMVLFLLPFTGCSTLQRSFCPNPDDRVYIDNAMFIKADKIYDECGTLDGVARILKTKEYWRKPEINEAIYRLKKVHNLPD